MNDYDPSLEIGLSDGISEEQAAEAAKAIEDAVDTRATIREQFEKDQVDDEEVNLEEKPDLGDYVKDTAVGVVGGLQDTASSLITLPERVIDFFTGEMGEEAKTDEGYKPEWDDWFVNDEKPIETKTWWGGLVRGVTHVGTTIAATGGVGAAKTLGGRLVQGAIAGAKFDLVSKTSQDDNVSGMLKEKIPFLDTALATQKEDHPMLKTFKNVVEGLGIGLVFDCVYEGLKFGIKTEVAQEAIKGAKAKGKKVISAAEQQYKNRVKSVETQKKAKAKEQLKSPEFGAYKNEKIADPWLGTAMSNETTESLVKAKRSIKNDWGSEEGTTGSFVSNVQVDNIARGSGEARKEVRNILKRIRSEGYIKQLDETAARQGITTEELISKDLDVLQQVYEGRATSGFTPEEFWRQIKEKKVEVKDGDKTLYEFVQPEYAHAIDLINASLLSDIRATGITGRELAEIADIRDIDGPAQQLVQKFIAGLQMRKLASAETSQMLRDFRSRYGAVRRADINKAVDADVNQSIEAFRMALAMAPEDGGDDLFKTIFEGISMTKDIHTLDDFDAFMRLKMRGGSFKGGEKQTGALIREMGTMFTHSVLSGPKTAVRAIMGTSSATFTRPLAMAIGGAMRGDWVTSRGGLAALNAMREAVPESFELFKRRLNAYWAGDISTMKTRYIERSKLDDQWDMYGHWAETRGDKVDKALFRTANLVRGANDNKFLTYSTKIMAATDDAFGLIIGRARAREKAFLQAAENLPDGNFVNLDENFFKDMEDKFNSQIFDAEGNITDAAAAYSKKEATLTQDLTGFSKKLADAFDTTPFVRPFFLFARTGINGLALTAKHTPGFNFLVKEWNDVAFAKPGSDLSALKAYGIETTQDLMNAKAVNQGRLALGSSAIFMASMAYLNGGLHGNGPTDRQKRQAWLDAGWKPRTIKLGNVWVNYDAFEPYNQILALIGDIGDHMDLMGEEWAEDNLLKLSVAMAGTITSKSYLAGLQSFVDLFSGAPGQQNRIIASIMNNTLPLSSLRNEIGKVLTPYTRELGSDIGSSIRNRNLISENVAFEPLPIKYDILTGRPIKEHNFLVRMFNAVSPVNFNLDYSPGRELLFNSGYDLRTSTYSAPDGTDLSNSPKVRSLYQRAIGEQNLEKILNNMARNPEVQISLAEMNYERNTGNKSTEPRSFPHYDKISKMFDRAKKQAWQKVKKENDVQKLLIEERNQKLQNRSANERTIDKILNLPSK